MATEITIERPPVYVHADGTVTELTILSQYKMCREKRQIFVAHRRGRKTSSTLEKVFSYLIANNGIVGKTLAPIRKQAKETIWDDPDMLFTIVPEQIIGKVNKSDLSIRLKNGSIWYLDGADQPNAHRGGNVRVLHLAETGDHKEEVWTSIYDPVLRANGGVALFEGNPRGQNWYHRLYENAERRNGWARFLMSAKDTPIFSASDLEDIRMSVPENVYLAEYLCEWVGSTGTVFRSIRDRATLEPSEVQTGRQYRIGIDLAKLQDFTVLSVVDRHTWGQVELERFNQLDWNIQKDKMKELIMRYSKRDNGNKAEVLIECNGVGDPIYDDLRAWSSKETEYDIMILPFRTTNDTKGLLVNNMSILSDQGLISLLHNSQLIDEFERFSYKKTALYYIYGAPDGYHDDIVMSTMLSYWDLKAKLPMPIEKEDWEPKHIKISNPTTGFAEETYLL